MDMQHYSGRLGAISPRQFQEALHNFNLGEFIQAEKIPFGLFGQNVFVTSSKGEFVLRGAPHFPWQFPTERFFVDQLHANTDVPVPYPYLVDETTSTFGWSYVIMPRLQGIQLADATERERIPSNERKAIARALGTNLCAMQRLTWGRSGRYSTTTGMVQPFELAQERSWPFPPTREPGPQPTFITHHEMIVAKIDGLIGRSRSHLTDDDVRWIERVLRAGRDALTEPFVPCFVLQDYKESNVVVRNTDGRWEVSGVFDFMESYFGDGEVDLSRPVAMYTDEDDELARAFLRAYLSTRPHRPGFVERFRVYMLAERLTVWEYFQRHGSPFWDENLTLREWSDPYVEFVSDMGL
jgi:aminoglycoside phosphotransferase (APT) family kinase protein